VLMFSHAATVRVRKSSEVFLGKEKCKNFVVERSGSLNVGKVMIVVIADSTGQLVIVRVPIPVELGV
jgi:hypothetical protein